MDGNYQPETKSNQLLIFDLTMYRLIVSTTMGRYYTGDIEGKFWFAVQNSTVGERFGCQESPSVIDYSIDMNLINYSIDMDSIDNVKDELEVIKKTLGDQLIKFEQFFKQNSGYNDQMLIEAGLDVSLLSEYADYGFGLKILKCLEANGYCEFQAEF
jgi:hypothetical protein